MPAEPNVTDLVVYQGVVHVVAEVTRNILIQKRKGDTYRRACVFLCPVLAYLDEVEVVYVPITCIACLVRRENFFSCRT